MQLPSWRVHTWRMPKWRVPTWRRKGRQAEVDAVSHGAQHGERRLRLYTAVCCLAMTLLVLGAERAGVLTQLERWFYDRRASDCQFFTPPATNRLVHLDIDDSALEGIGRWPWHRSTMADILDEIHAAGAKAVALDVLFLEPQKTRWEPESFGPDGSPSKLARIDDDAKMADSIRRMDDVLVPTSLSIDPAAPPAVRMAVRGMLANDLELTEGEVIAALKAAGHREKDLDTSVRNKFLDVRREAALDRILKEMDDAEADGRPPPSADDLTRQLVRRSGEQSPAARLVEAEYDQAQAIRTLRRLAPPLPPGCPPLYKPDTVAPPILPFARTARATSFVDYPVFRDGVVRSVPLFVEYDHRLYPQIGLMLAAMMLDADVRDFRLTPTTVTLPGKGPGGRDLVLPVRTHEPEGGGRAVPMMFDVPWVGNREWANTFKDQPHLSIVAVYEMIQRRERISASNAELDKAINLVLLAFDQEKAKEYAAHPLPLNDPLARQGRIDEVLATVDPFVPAGTVPETETEDELKKKYPDPDKRAQAKADAEANRRTVIAVNSIREAKVRHPQLKDQLDKQAELLRSRLKDNAVLIGWAATAQAADRKPTSIHPEAPGVVVHGTIVNAVLTGQAWRTLPEWMTLAVTALLGAAATWAVARLTPAKGMAACTLLLAAYLTVNGIVLFDWGNLILGLAAPVVVVATVWSGGTVTRLVMEGIERARITRRFGAYVDPELVDFVLEHEDLDVFAGEERVATVVFTDLAGFTALSEKLGPEIIAVLNDYMGRATKVIRKYHGYVNKFLGDGIMFFFNAPRPRAGYAADAVRCVLDLEAMLREFNVELAERGLPPLSQRAGITTGPMVVGDAGSAERCDYTVLGDLVNLSSRLESANKAVGTSNLISEQTLETADPDRTRFVVRPVGRLQVVGQTIGVGVFEVLGVADAATDDQRRLADLTKAVVELSDAGRQADCVEALNKLEEEFGESKLTHLYRDKCECYLRDPSAGVWERQIVLTQK